MVAAPAARGLEGPASGENGPRRHGLVVDLAVHASQPPHGGRKVAVVLSPWKDPLVEPFPSVAETVLQAFVGSGDESVERHRHVQYGRGHRYTPRVGASAGGLPALPF